jgi:AcrR family transcriptional regulator
VTAAPRRTRARRGDGELLRADLLGVAEQLLVEAGEAAVTLRAVAARAGVSTPSVYLHFADKAALVDAVALSVWGQLARLIATAAATSPDPFEALRLRGLAYIRFGLAHPVQYRLLMMRPPVPGAEDAELAAASDCFCHVVAGARACVDAGVFLGDPTALALGLWAACHGCVSLLIAKPQFPWPADLDAFIEDTVRMAGMGTAVMSRLVGPPRPVSHVLPGQLDALAHHLAAASDQDQEPT